MALFPFLTEWLGHIRQFSSTSGKGFFLSEQNVLLKDFSADANQVTADIVSHAQKLAASEKRPLLYLPSSQTSKEQTALQILQEHPLDEGLICILSVVEYCQTLQPQKHGNGLLSLDTVNRKCKYFYIYFLDKHFGFMHIKLQTWFPFLIQVYINGREMMKHTFNENGISYQMYDNSFFEVRDIVKAQELADRFDSNSLCRQLDLFAHGQRILSFFLRPFQKGSIWSGDLRTVISAIVLTGMTLIVRKCGAGQQGVLKAKRTRADPEDSAFKKVYGQ